MYAVLGRTRLKERPLRHLAGYRASQPVRIGNDAYRQRQLDVYGEVVTAADAVVAGGDRLDATEARMLAGLGDLLCRQRPPPDTTTSELPAPPPPYTFSQLSRSTPPDRLPHPP